MTDTPSDAAPPAAEAPAANAPTLTKDTAAAGGDAGRAGARKVREGIVVSNKMDKTVVVSVVEHVRHRRYNKTVRRSTKLFVHDEGNECRPGDRVRVMETRPLSKQKRWRLVEIVERAR